MRARRWDSLNVNGIAVSSPGVARRNKKTAASTDVVFAGGPADLATRVAVVPWLCVTVFRRLCSEQRNLFSAASPRPAIRDADPFWINPGLAGATIVAAPPQGAQVVQASGAREPVLGRSDQPCEPHFGADG